MSDTHYQLRKYLSGSFHLLDTDVVSYRSQLLTHLAIGSFVSIDVSCYFSPQNIDEIDEIEMGPNLRDSADQVRSLPDTRPEPEEVYIAVKAIKKLWESAPIQAAYARRSQFQVSDDGTNLDYLVSGW